MGVCRFDPSDPGSGKVTFSCEHGIASNEETAVNIRVFKRQVFRDVFWDALLVSYRLDDIAKVLTASIIMSMNTVAWLS
jgi:hypothetical protein